MQPKFYTVIAMLYVTIILISNIAAQKLSTFAGLIFPAAIWLIPISYIFDDILTEVYGYARSRIVIWAAIVCNLLAALLFELLIYVPAAKIWHDQSAYALILGSVPHIVIASLISIAFGQFCNAFVLAKMKLWTNGKYLCGRMVASTAVGVAVDSVLFIFIAFYGVIPTQDILLAILSQYVIKLGYEIVGMPLSYFVIIKLKKIEKIDVYDRHTNFNPFSLKLKS